MVSTYRATHTSKMKYNKNNIISILVSSYDSMVGVPNTTLYGYTYNVKTSKKLTLKNVTNYSECVIAFKPYTVTSGGTYSSVTIKSKYK